MNYVQNQLIGRNKLDKVYLTQELLIIYLYLFHRNYYNDLLNNHSVVQAGKSKTEIENLINRILFTNNSLRISFKKNPTSYFIDDLATNHSMAELIETSKNKEELKSIFYIKNKKDYLEFYYFITKDVAKKDYSFMAEVAIEVVGSSEYEMPNDLIRFVLQKYASQLYDGRKTKINSQLSEQEKLKYKASADEYVISKFEKIQKEADHVVTNGKKLHIYRELVDLFNLEQFSYDDYAQKYFKQIIISSEKEKDFGRKPYDAETLLYVLNFNYDHINFSKFYTKISPTVESQVEIIENLCDTEYLYFWNIYLMYPREFLPVVSDGNLLYFDQLRFSYKGEIYANHVLARCRAIRLAMH